MPVNPLINPRIILGISPQSDYSHPTCLLAWNCNNKEIDGVRLWKK